MLPKIYAYFACPNRIFQILFFYFLFFSCFAFPRPVLGAYVGQYWNLASPISNPVFPERTPDYTGSDPNVYFDWGEGAPAAGVNTNGFVARWTQAVDFSAGTYNFGATADDGVRVYIDNVLIINSWIDQAPCYYSALRDISAGEHEIKIEYYENAGGAVIQFSYENLSPVVQTYFPVDDAIGVNMDNNLRLTFDKDVTVFWGSEDDIAIYDTDDYLVEAIRPDQVSISDNIVTINPAAVYEDLADYYIKIKPDVFRSSGGYGYSGISYKTTWNFRTGDFAKPDTGDDYAAKDGLWQNSNQTIVLGPSDPLPSSGIAWTRYCTDDGTVKCDPAAGTRLVAPYQITIADEGMTYLRYASQDNSGNTQDTVSRGIKIDKTLPDIDVGDSQISSLPFRRIASVSDLGGIIDNRSYAWTKVSGPGVVTFSDRNSLSTFIDADIAGTYIIRFSAADIAGNLSSDTFIFTKVGNVSLPSQAYVDPIIPAAGFGIKINGGATVALHRNVSLEFIAGPNIKKMAISTSSDFSDAGIEAFRPVRSWDLCTKHIGGTKDPVCADGEYTVYVRFYTIWGRVSQTVSASINLVSGSQDNFGSGTVTPFESTENSTSVIDQSGSNQADIITPVSRFIFMRYLHLGMIGEDVRQLQMFLNRNGFKVASSGGSGSSGNETTYFGTATKQALIRLQKKYNLKPYPGSVGPITLKFLNSFP